MLDLSPPGLDPAHTGTTKGAWQKRAASMTAAATCASLTRKLTAAPILEIPEHAHLVPVHFQARHHPHDHTVVGPCLLATTATATPPFPHPARSTSPASRALHCTAESLDRAAPRGREALHVCGERKTCRHRHHAGFSPTVATEERRRGEGGGAKMVGFVLVACRTNVGKTFSSLFFFFMADKKVRFSPFLVYPKSAWKYLIRMRCCHIVSS